MRHDHLHLKVDEIIRLLHLVLAKESRMATDLSTLEAAVKSNTDAEQSAAMLLSSLSAKVAELATTTQDPKVQALADQINANTAAWAAAVVANTPAAAAP